MDDQATLSPRVLAVVVTHNGRTWLESCLRSLAAQTYAGLDVIVVDNASRSPVERGVRKLLPEAEFLRTEENLGFGAAANAALEFSQHAPQADYYLFLHDDVALDEACAGLMVLAAIESGAGVVGGKGVGWDEPDRLIEVGMSADQLGYAFSGLEDGEIDQGQHDASGEVLFVTSACILISRALIERCGSWDGSYFAFGEDLDLCLRARLAGFKVFVQPAAVYRHAVALAGQLREADSFRSIRFYTRRNRLRTIAKTAAAYRIWALLLLFGVLTMGEIVILAALRRFDELGDYPKAFWSFVITLPDVIRRRRAVQKRRTVPDRRIRRLMVRDLHRARVFLERRLREWEVDTLKLGTRTLSQLSPAHIKQVVAVWIRKPATLLMVLLLAVVAIAMRKTLFGEPLAAGGIWPFPSPTRSLITEYLAGWRDVGVGTSSAAPASFPILWLVGLLSFGRERLAQALLVAGATGIGVVGMWRFVAKRTALSWAKLAAVAVYLLGMGHRTMVETADLGALALFAGAPFIADIVFRMLGSTPGEDGDRASTPLTTDAMTREAVRLGLVAAPLVALGPSALIALGFFFLVVWLHTLGVAWDRGEVVRRARWLLAALGITIAVLIPWSLEGLRPSGAILGPIFSGFGGGDSYRPLWSDSGFLSLILLNPARSARPLFAAAVPVTLALGAVALSSPSRRREGRLLLSMWLAFGLVGGAASKGWIPAPVASPAMWMAFPLAASAALAGHFLVGLKQELPRHVLGWRHVASAVVAVVVAAGFALGWAPGLAGWQRPGSTLAAPAGDLARSINSFFISNAETVGEFRILWLGDEWVDPVRPAVRRMEGTQYFVTGEGGLTMLDAHDPSPVEGERRLDAIVEALAARQLHQAGHLLAPASIRYIVVDTNDESMMSAMARQRDIGLEHQQSEIAVFRNLQWLPRAALIPPGLGSVAGSEVRDDRALMLAEWVGGRRIPGESDTSFRGELPRTHHAAILIGDNFNAGWRATAGGRSLEHTAAFGWANQFDLPQGTSGEVRVSYSRRWVRIIWLVLQIWVVTMAVAMTRVSGGVRGSVR